MKRTISVRNAVLQLTFIVAVLFIASCSSSAKPEDSKDVAEDQNKAALDNTGKEMDAQFLVDAAEISLQEIDLGKLAQQKGSADHVRDLGKMMQDAHRKSLSDLTALAKGKMINIPESPTDDAIAAYKKLDEKSGNDFNKAYSDMMVTGHKDAIALFEKAAADSYDADIKNWAAGMLPGLREHMISSAECQKECDKM